MNGAEFIVKWRKAELKERSAAQEHFLDLCNVFGHTAPAAADPTVEDRSTFKVGTVRYPRLVARDADCAVRLKDRTLTKLYNARPAWLADCLARHGGGPAAARDRQCSLYGRRN